MLNVSIKPIILSVIMLNVAMLSVVVPLTFLKGSFPFEIILKSVSRSETL